MKKTRIEGLVLSFESDGKLLARGAAHAKAARVPPMAVAVLSFCGLPRQREEVVQQFGAAGGALFDGLCDAGLLANPEEAASTPVFFQNFASLDIHRRMLADQRRLDVYRSAIEEVLKPGDVVIDAGCGSGVLACMAACAGATRVFAVDNSDILALTREVVHRSDLEATVRCVRSDIRTFEAPEPVDVIVTETFGAFALAEGSLHDLSACQATNLKPNGVVIPNAITLYLAPTDDPALLDQAFGPFLEHDGFRLDPLAEAAETRAITLEVAEESLLSPGQPTWSFSYPGPTPSERVQLSFQPDRSGNLCGFVGWFCLHMSPSHDLDTAPAAPGTHWQQVYFPIRGPAITPADRLHCTAQLAVPSDDPRGLELTLDLSLNYNSSHHFFRIR